MHDGDKMRQGLCTTKIARAAAFCKASPSTGATAHLRDAIASPTAAAAMHWAFLYALQRFHEQSSHAALAFVQEFDPQWEPHVDGNGSN